MKYVKPIQLIMCKIKKYNLISDRTAKTKSNASETEQHDIFSYIITCKNTFEIAVLIFTPKSFTGFIFNPKIHLNWKTYSYKYITGHINKLNRR